MKTLTIKQPWAWLIINGYKDIENRSWPTAYRGPLVIHSGATSYTNKQDDALKIWAKYGIKVPEDLDYGGVVGVVEVVDCAEESESPWFFGDCYGWKLSKPKAVKFIPCKGKLKLWDLPKDVEKKVVAGLTASKVQRKRKTPGPREDIAILDELDPMETFIWLRKVLKDNPSVPQNDLLEAFAEALDYPEITPLVKKIFAFDLAVAQLRKIVEVNSDQVSLATTDLTDYDPDFVRAQLETEFQEYGEELSKYAHQLFGFERLTAKRKAFLLPILAKL